MSFVVVVSLGSLCICTVLALPVAIRSLQRDPRHLEQHEVVELLLEDRLIFSRNVLPGSAWLALRLAARGIRTTGEIREL